MMIVVCLFLGYLITDTISVKSRPEDDFYYASVVEYNPFAGKDGNDTLFKNAKEYVRLIKIAAGSADIIVFPELGLNYDDISIYVEIPFGNGSIAPVDNSSLHPVLRQLSNAAKDNQVYVSFTIHEKDESPSGEVLKYNTNVVFDRNGIIVARYRKYNLFNENHLNITKVPEVAFFDSDFGVRFGMFICFDIFFKEPALTLVNEKHITDIIFPSWWFSELPSLLSVQMQFSWAYMTDTNLLAAGINSIERSSTGSGIYAGKKGPLVYRFSDRGETQILTAKIYKKGKKGDVYWSKSELQKDTFHDSDLVLWNEDLSSYETHLLTPFRNNGSETDFKNNLIVTQILNRTMCQGALCCEFKVNMTFTYRPEAELNMSDTTYIRNDSFFHYHYRLAMHDGVRGFYGAKTAGIQVCSIMPCLNYSLSSCGRKSGNTLPLMIENSIYGKIFLYSTSFNSISIKAVSKNFTDFTFPDVLESSGSSDPKAFGSIPEGSKINFNTNHFTSNLQFSSEKLAFAAVYSRIVSRDGQTKNSTVKCTSCTFLSVFIALFIIFSLRKMYAC
ncbi:vanin-like protein 2 [Halyomorpha halys]|uniref:vanin-like protein 2 n=1 Tax=Halyomorpha halys TaxID=286706 RepID=UPI0006D50228|nr:vanin-like protein 2 [Halyomorpha halys]